MNYRAMELQLDNIIEARGITIDVRAFEGETACFGINTITERMYVLTNIDYSFDIEGHAELRLLMKAHEYGHAIDYIENWKKDVEAWCIYVNADKVMCEHVAWRYAIIELDKMGYDNWEYFLEKGSDWLHQYYKEFRPGESSKEFLRGAIRELVSVSI